MKKYGVLIVGILFLMAFASVSFAAQVKEEVEEIFSLAEEGSVSVENVVGEILIHAWDEDEVQMVATKWVRALTQKRAEELLEAIEIDITAKEDSLDIDTDFPWRDKLDPTSSVEVDYELWVPPSVEVSAQSVSGRIQIVERENDVWAKTISGTLEIESIVGDVEAKTTSGRIRSEFKVMVEGEIEKRSLRGSIGEGGIKITLKTTSGDISLEKT